MTYQALARKWRPRNFGELAGQEHVVRALANALERGRLHHAYLLTGTRGVGKTTIARILAKSLNCERDGVTPSPCGVCAACTDIDAGRFVDLLELDAASNTGIDNMREILDNARYAPTVGRYKVYLIDEVHMLSKQAFNSMLKTLEEPPEHVKFVLATTDPQKIPITVLSRCLQFNLKPLPKPLIASRLAEILEAEAIGFDAAALALVAQSAKGSMRDALSVLDQAIAHGAGEVREDAVRAMLGVTDGGHVYRIVEALVAGDGPALLREAAAIAEQGLSAAAALDDLASLFHRVAVLHAVPAAAEAWPDAARLAGYARAFSPEMTQLVYQIAVQGRADLALAPDEQMGLAMTLLRLLAFEPVTAEAQETTASPVASGRPGWKEGSEQAPASEKPVARPRVSLAAAPEPVAAESVAQARSDTQNSVSESTPSSLPEPAHWPRFVASLKLSGIVQQLAAQTELRHAQGNDILLHVPEAGRHLIDKVYADKLKAALEQALGCRLRLRFEVSAAPVANLAVQEKQAREKAQARTEANFNDDPFVRDIVSRFDAKVQPNSIKPA